MIAQNIEQSRAKQEIAGSSRTGYFGFLREN